MRRSETRTAGYAALAGFLVVFGGLTAHRVFDVGLPTTVQSALVWTGAAVVVAAVAAISYRGWRFIECWLVALGPTLGFAWNLPFTLAGGDQRLSLAVFAYTGVGGVLVATVLAIAGYAVGVVATEAVTAVDD